eukprot:134520-Amphidinium_carterae.1
MTNWETLKESSDVTICALTDRVDDTVIVDSGAYVKLCECFDGLYVSKPERLKASVVRSQLYGAYTKQGVGVTVRGDSRIGLGEIGR